MALGSVPRGVDFCLVLNFHMSTCYDMFYSSGISSFSWWGLVGFSFTSFCFSKAFRERQLPS